LHFLCIIVRPHCWIAWRHWAMSPAFKLLHIIWLGLWHSQVWSVFSCDLKSFTQPMTVCLPWLNSYRCHTQLYAELWKYLSSYSKLVHLCVWILFMWFHKSKVSCLVVFGNEGTFGPTAGMLSRESRTNPLTWEIMWIYPSWQCFLRLCHRTHLYSTFWDYPDGKTTKLNVFWDLVSSGIVRSIKW